MTITADSPTRASWMPHRGGWAAAGIYAVIVLILYSAHFTSQPLISPVLEGVASGRLSLIILLLGSLATAYRTVRPVLTLCVTGALSLLEILGGTQVAAYFLLGEALWVGVAHGSRTTARWTTMLGVLVSLLTIAWSLSVDDPVAGLLAGLLMVFLGIAFPLCWAWEVRILSQATTQAQQLAALERELSAERSARALETERRRLAHELHDLVASHLSAASLHLNLASELQNPEAGRASLDVARDNVRLGMNDLRGIIEMLTDDTEAPGTTMSWADLRRRLETGDPHAVVIVDPELENGVTLEPVVENALLRVASEVVTNALTHGRSPRRLEIGRTGTHVHIRCTNRMRDDARMASGLGLETIRVRAQALGGCSEAGPDAEDPGKWRVEVNLPIAREGSHD